MDVEVAGEALTLLPDRAVFWKARETLIVSDLHLGKAGHFRKHGIPVSRKVHISDLQTLGSLIRNHRAKQVILLGDLFHSFENNEWNDFLEFLKVFDSSGFTLVEGNHDILSTYPSALELKSVLDIPPFSFTHIRTNSDLYNISGHVHPGVSVRGRARQSITLPCFYLSTDHGILPAFGQFTGVKKIRPKQADRVYGIADGRVIELP